MNVVSKGVHETLTAAIKHSAPDLLQTISLSSSSSSVRLDVAKHTSSNKRQAQGEPVMSAGRRNVC
jgi:hypothetical protein